MFKIFQACNNAILEISIQTIIFTFFSELLVLLREVGTANKSNRGSAKIIIKNLNTDC